MRIGATVLLAAIIVLIVFVVWPEIQERRAHFKARQRGRDAKRGRRWRL